MKASPPPSSISRRSHSKSSCASSLMGSTCTAFFTAMAPMPCRRRQIFTRRYAGFAGSWWMSRSQLCASTAGVPTFMRSRLYQAGGHVQHMYHQLAVCIAGGWQGGQAPGATAAASIAPQLVGVAAAIEIKRVIEMPLAADRFVVVVTMGGGEPPEPFRDRLEAGRFRREIAPRRVGPAHDQRQAANRLVLHVVFLDDRIERTFFTVVAEFDAGNVVRDGARLARHALDLADRSEQEFRIAIDERANEPRTGNAIDFYISACNPFHRNVRAGGNDQDADCAPAMSAVE